MKLYQQKKYIEDIERIASEYLPWKELTGKTILLSGATGLIGSFLIDVIMWKNIDCSIYALGRSETRAKERFSYWWGNKNLIFLPYDVNQTFINNDLQYVDYVFHLASNTHPIQYATDPIGTITTNIIGLQNMLEFAVKHRNKRFVFASSNEIYGENRGDTELFSESYCGYINPNTLRAGYPESKRCGEALCQAYKAQKGLDIVIARFTRSYGPTMQMTDTKAISQFIKKGVYGKDIVLKSAGTQNYSYTYVADAVSGLLTLVLNGQNGEAYNIADESSNIALRDLAGLIAEYTKRKVIFETPDVTEAAGYSKATKALLDGSKLKGIGWKPFYSIRDGVLRTIEILRSMM